MSLTRNTLWAAYISTFDFIERMQYFIMDSGRHTWMASMNLQLKQHNMAEGGLNAISLPLWSTEPIKTSLRKVLSTVAATAISRIRRQPET